MARQVLENGVILPAEYSDDWYDDMTSNLTKLDDVIGSDSEKLSSADVGAAALSNNYNDLDNLPTIPTVNDATLTIQKNGVNVQTFTANSSSNVTANITVPTKTSDITNDSNFVDTSNSAVASGITSAKVTSYDTHIADTDIHVTTADKTKWNNQTYVFRYSSTALVASSTNSNTLLDNTDNLKVGDKVIDSSGVLFSITAIDTQNSTFIIGTALVDLAQDSDVVHKSGNETIAGVKSFSDDTYIKSLNFTSEVPSPSSSSSSVMPIITTITYGDSSPSVQARLNLRVTGNGIKSVYPHENNQYALGLTSRKWSEVHAVTYYYGSNDTEFSDKFVTTDTAQTIGQNKTFTGVITINHAKGGIFQLTCPDLDNTIDVTGHWAEFISFNSVDGGQTVASKGAVGLRQFKNGKNFALLLVEGSETLYFGSKSNSDSTKALYPANSGVCDLGTSTNKWKSFNGLEPSSLGMPDLSNGIDISSYIDVKQTSQYTAPANGYISICGYASSTNTILLKDHDYDFGITARAMLMGSNTFTTHLIIPVIKNHVYDIICNAVTTLSYAKFYPCQGNV